MNEIMMLNSRIHVLTMNESVLAIENMIKTGKPHQHMVVNAAKMVMMQKDESLREAVNASDLINADGQAVVWASRFLGKPLPERVAGIDLFTNLIYLAAEKGYRPYFLGAKKSVVEQVVKRFTDQYPKLSIAGYRDGYFERRDDVEKKIAEEIKASKADMLFVAISSPFKEIFLNKWLTEMNIPFAMGVGGSFDVIAGVTNRAPVWMQKMGLEWFFRILQEPGRMWKRYAKTNFLFIWYTLKAKFKS